MPRTVTAYNKVAEYAERFDKQLEVFKTHQIDGTHSQCLYRLNGGDIMLLVYDADENEMNEIALEAEMIEAIAKLAKED